MSLRDAAYSEIRKWILEGVIAPGSDLREIELARKLKTSRTPVREALYRLGAEGLLRRNAGSGYSLAEFTREDLEKVYEIREALESLAARLAAKNRTRAQLGRLADLIDASEQAIKRGDYAKVSELASSFHQTIFEASDNSYLKQMLDEIHHLLVRHRPPTPTDKRLRKELHLQHYAILDALTARDEEECVRLVHEHICHALKVRVVGLGSAHQTPASKKGKSTKQKERRATPR